MQARVGGGPVLQPERPQREQVQPRAEAELGDGEPVAPGPGAGQAAAGEEDRAGFGQPVIGGEVDVARGFGDRRAVVAPVEVGQGRQTAHGAAM